MSSIRAGLAVIARARPRSWCRPEGRRQPPVPASRATRTATGLSRPSWPGFRGFGEVQVLRGTGTRNEGYPTAKRISRNAAGVRGEATEGDELGAAVALGDFDDDGCADVAIGVPGASRKAGAVHVPYGSPGAGITAEGDQLFTQTRSAGAPANRTTGSGRPSRWGTSTATAATTSRSALLARPSAPGTTGAVWLLYGSPWGLNRAAGKPPVQRTQDSLGVPGTPEVDDRMGYALAAGNFDGEGGDELAVGVPGEDHGAGSLIVLGGKGAKRPVRSFDEDTAGIPDEKGIDNYFGKALATGDADADGRDDVAIGIPGESGGAAVVLYGSVAGFHEAASRGAAQRMSHYDDANPDDEIGAALAFGMFDGDAHLDLAIGAPGDALATWGDKEYGAVWFNWVPPRASARTATGPPSTSGSPSTTSRGEGAARPLRRIAGGPAARAREARRAAHRHPGRGPRRRHRRGCPAHGHRLRGQELVAGPNRENLDAGARQARHEGRRPSGLRARLSVPPI